MSLATTKKNLVATKEGFAKTKKWFATTKECIATTKKSLATTKECFESYGAEEAAKCKGSSSWIQRFKERHNILLRRRTNKEKVGADDGRDTIQKFHRD